MATKKTTANTEPCKDCPPPAGFGAPWVGDAEPEQNPIVTTEEPE